MRPVFRSALCISLAGFFLLLLPARLFALTVDIVSTVIQDNKRVDSAAIRAQLTKTSGPISSETIDQDIKTLYKTGFFDQVTARITETDRGAVLTYAVVEKPLVRKVFIRGNKKIKESELRDVLKFNGGRFLDRSRIQALMRNGVSYYQSQGYYDATFDYSVVPVGDNQVDVTFIINEGSKFKIKDIEFVGLKNVDPSDLREAMQTKEYKWWNSWLLGTGRLNPGMLDNDRNLIRQYFLDHGYIDATVSDPHIEQKDKGLYITFDVAEGNVYTIGTLTASGDLVDGSVEQTLEGIKSEKGEDFSASKLREDTFTISEKFTDKGYAFANVVPNTTLDHAASTVSVDFTVSKGNPVMVNQIHIKGNAKTYDNVIRRELTIGEQEMYSSAKIKRSQKLLERLGYFEEVNIATEPTDDKDKVDLGVNVREAATGTFSAGAGFSSSDGALFNARLTENNIFGTGRSLSFNADIGTERDNFVISYNDNRLNDSHVAWGVDLLRSDRDFDDFDRRLMGGATELGYPLEQVFGEWAQDIAGSVKYELLAIDISNINPNDAAQLVLNSQGKSTSSSITPKLTRNTINNPLNPSTGSKQVLSFEYSGLGGDQDFYVFEGRNQVYRPLFKTDAGEYVFSWRTTATYGKSNTEEPFPLFKRYFPGGI
ncbi:MAG: outer membrane protein assembly factor BamA, partial [Deltaproteobacteria bacterium]|nr:outer membrane protein assembly factor BamA [Deltaproteobacteria bacterium]